METNGFAVFDATTNDVNGGSLRVYVTHEQVRRPKTESFCQLMKQEKDQRLEEPDIYRVFFEKVQKLKSRIRSYIRAEVQKGNLVIGLGASTKGNVLLQFFEIDRQMLPYVSERNPEKVSLRTLGTDIELISEEQGRALNPSCMLVLIWFFKEEILKRERPYLERGGKLLFPMPYAHLVTKDGEERL